MTAPKRRWLWFSLCTLLVVVACFSAWLVGEFRFVNQRREFGEAIFPKGGYFSWDANSEIPVTPWWWEWLGDYGPVEQIRVPFTYEAEFRHEAARLFPEAKFLPLSKEEIEQEQRDRESQRREEAEEAERKEHLRRGDWFLKDGEWHRLTPLPDDAKKYRDQRLRGSSGGKVSP
jgi:hypothetical protein